MSAATARRQRRQAAAGRLHAVREVPAPRFAPARSQRRSYGAPVARVADALGTGLQRWQRLVADVGLEVEPDGAWRFSDLVVTVPRQAGKSTLLGPLNLHRCLMRTDARVWLTAQTRQLASDLIMTELGSRLTRSEALRSTARVRRAIGSEGLYFVNGSTLRPFAPSEDGLHGQRSDLVDVDEVWSHGEASGTALEQAVRPTLTTTGGQVVWTSTAGTASSVLLRRLVDAGRAGAPGIALFDWSTPDDVTADIDALLRDGAPEATERAVSLCLEHHPGEFVHRSAVLAAARSMAPGEFLRAFCNRWTEASETLIPPHRWDMCRASGTWPAPSPGRVALGVDSTPDRAHCVIGAAWRVDGAVLVDVWDEPEMHHAPQRLRELSERWQAKVAADAGGPAVAVLDSAVTHATLARRRAVRLQSPDYSAACSQLLQAIISTELSHPGHSALDESIPRAQARPLGDRFVWDRRAGDVAALGAVTAAMWALDHTRQMDKPTLRASS